MAAPSGTVDIWNFVKKDGTTVRKWLRDSWARKNIARMKAVNDPSVLCTVTPIEPTLDAGTHYSPYGNCWYYKIGHRVTVHIGVSGLTASTDTLLWTLPEGFRPRNAIGWVGNASGIGSYARFRITYTGAVRVHSASQYALGEISFDAFS